jgi:L-fuconolactonase
VTEVRDSDWDIDLLLPYFDTTLRAFGAERVMFGSDWPVCLSRVGYGQWVAAVGKLSAELSASEAAAFYAGTAVSAYNL